MTDSATAGSFDSSLPSLVAQTLGAEVAVELSGLLPTLVADLEDVDRRLSQVLGSTYAELTESARYACATGGKRVRPLLMATAARALGAESTRGIVSLAAAFQLIHTATLVHDDVIDHADTRRGRPSMPRAFGVPLAIVTGDYLFVRAFELAAEYPRAIILRCGESCAELVEGEVLQEASRFDLSVGREHYFRVAERKTSAIISAALASVAEIVGAAPPAAESLATYGRALGIAFQVRDDLLDVFGDTDLLGKPLFNDFREGNPTLVVLECVRPARPPAPVRVRATVPASKEAHEASPEIARAHRALRRGTRRRPRGGGVGGAFGPRARHPADRPLPAAPRTARLRRGRPPVLVRAPAPRKGPFGSNESYISRALGRLPATGPMSRNLAASAGGGGGAGASGSVEFDRLPAPWEPTPVRPHLPIGVAIVSGVIAIFALVMLLAGLLFMLNAYFGTIFPPSIEIFQSIDLLGAAILVILGAALLSIATALWHQETWALWTTIVLVFATTAYLFFTGSITVLFVIFVVLLVYLLAVRRYFY